MDKVIAFFVKYLGWRNWSVLIYNSIIENIFIVFYIALRRDIVVFDFFVDLFCFVCFSVFSTTYGYLINDLADMELDARHGKANTFMADAKGKATAIVALFFMISVVFGLRFAGNPFFLLLWLVWFLSATFYSLKPLRLKERGKVGLAVVVLAQRVLPILLLFAAFSYDVRIEVVVFTAYVLFRGLSSDLNHQISDYRNDALTRTQTFAVDAGLSRAEKLFHFSLDMEKALLLVSLLVMYLNASASEIFGLSLFGPPLVAGVAMVGTAWYKTMAFGIRVNPFEAGRKDLYQFIHHGFPSVVLPFYLLLALVIWHWQFVAILIVLGIYRRMYSREIIMKSFPFRVVRGLKAGRR